jgi:hypothetical protein
MGHAQPIPILQWLARSDSFVVVTYARHLLSLRKVEYLLAERGSTSAMKPYDFDGIGLAVVRDKDPKEANCASVPLPPVALAFG